MQTQKSDASDLTQRSQILEAQSVTSPDESSVVTTPSNTWCQCPHIHCKRRSQARGFSQQPNHLVQHMRHVYSEEVPISSDERDNERTTRFLPKSPPLAEDAKSENTPSVSALARPVASRAWTKISDPPTDSASQRAGLGRYNTKNHTFPAFRGSRGGRGAYDIASVQKPKISQKPDDSKEQDAR